MAGSGAGDGGGASGQESDISKEEVPSMGTYKSLIVINLEKSLREREEIEGRTYKRPAGKKTWLVEGTESS